MRPHLATLVDDLRRHGKDVAVVTHRGNRRLRTTYAQLAELSARLAAELTRRGIVPGDRVVLWGQNSAEWVAAFFGCVLRGVIAVPLDTAGSPSFTQRVLADVQPRLLVADAELLLTLSPAFAPTVALHTLAAALPTPDYGPAPGLTRETPLQIIFTSGTTAEPKGIVHTHGNVLASLDPLEREMQKYLRYERLVHPLRFLHTLPLSHVFGQFMGLWLPPLLGAQVHFEARLQAPRLIRILHQERITVLAAVPRVLDLLRAHLIAEDPQLAARVAALAEQPIWRRWWRLRHLHHNLGYKCWAFVSGGAALPPDLEAFWTTAGFALIQGYGMTETTALVTLNHPFKTARGSIGKPLAGREVEVTPEGEIRVRGASIAQQVWRGGAMAARSAAQDDWLATGDLVTRDPRGELVFAGRKSNVIVTSAGLNIHPEDLEAALHRQPGVRDAVIVPFASPAGPVPAAVLLADPTTAQAAVAAANRELAEFQQILYSLLWPQPDLPRTSTGKVLRRDVEDWAQHALTPGASPATAALNHSFPGDSLLSLLQKMAPAVRGVDIRDETRLSEDLHLDSLALVQLQAALETQFGIELDDAAWQQVRTVGDLRQLTGHPTAPLVPTAGLTADSAASIQASAPEPPTRGVTETQPTRTPQRPARAPHRYPHWPWSPLVRFLRVAFLETVARPLVRLLAAPRIQRLAPTPAEPSLLIANHVTAFDVPLVLYALAPRHRRRVAVAMSGEMLTGWRRASAQHYRWLAPLAPLAYWLLTALFNVFPLPRGAGLRQSFAHAGEALDRGYHVLVFPEGRRSTAGELQPFEAGIGLLAKDSLAPVQPIILEGLGPLKERRQGWFRPGTIAVRLGPPLSMDPGEDPAHFTQRLYTALQQLQIPAGS